MSHSSPITARPSCATFEGSPAANAIAALARCSDAEAAFALETTAKAKPTPHLNADSTAIDRLVAVLRVCSVADVAAALDGVVDLGGDQRLRKAARELRRKSWGRSKINDNDALSEMEGYLTSGAARSIWQAAGLAAATRFGKQTFLSVQKRLDEKFREKFPGKYLNAMNRPAKSISGEISNGEFSNAEA